MRIYDLRPESSRYLQPIPLRMSDISWISGGDFTTPTEASALRAQIEGEIGRDVMLPELANIVAKLMY